MNEDEVLTRWWDAREAGHTWRKMVGWRPPRVKWLHAAHANKAINWALQRWKAWRIATHHALKDKTMELTPTWPSDARACHPNHHTTLPHPLRVRMADAHRQ